MQAELVSGLLANFHQGPRQAFQRGADLVAPVATVGVSRAPRSTAPEMSLVDPAIAAAAASAARVLTGVKDLPVDLLKQVSARRQPNSSRVAAVLDKAPPFSGNAQAGQASSGGSSSSPGTWQQGGCGGGAAAALADVPAAAGTGGAAAAMPSGQRNAKAGAACASAAGSVAGAAQGPCDLERACSSNLVPSRPRPEDPRQAALKRHPTAPLAAPLAAADPPAAQPGAAPPGQDKQQLQDRHQAREQQDQQQQSDGPRRSKRLRATADASPFPDDAPRAPSDGCGATCGDSAASADRSAASRPRQPPAQAAWLPAPVPAPAAAGAGGGPAPAATDAQWSCMAGLVDGMNVSMPMQIGASAGMGMSMSMSMGMGMGMGLGASSALEQVLPMELAARLGIPPGCSVPEACAGLRERAASGALPPQVARLLTERLVARQAALQSQGMQMGAGAGGLADLGGANGDLHARLSTQQQLPGLGGPASQQQQLLQQLLLQQQLQKQQLHQQQLQQLQQLQQAQAQAQFRGLQGAAPEQDGSAQHGAASSAKHNHQQQQQAPKAERGESPSSSTSCFTAQGARAAQQQQLLMLLQSRMLAPPFRPGQGEGGTDGRHPAQMLLDSTNGLGPRQALLLQLREQQMQQALAAAQQKSGAWPSALSHQQLLHQQALLNEQQLLLLSHQQQQQQQLLGFGDTAGLQHMGMYPPGDRSAGAGAQADDAQLGMPPPGQLLVSSSADAALDLPVLALPGPPGDAAPSRPSKAGEGAGEAGAAAASDAVLMDFLPLGLDFGDDDELAACLGL